MLVHVCEWSELMLSHRPWPERLDYQFLEPFPIPTQVSIDGKSVTASGRSLARAHSRQPSIDLHPASKRDLATVSSSDDDSAERVRRFALEPCFLSWSPGSQRERHNSPQCLPRAWCARASANAQRGTFSTATATALVQQLCGQMHEGRRSSAHGSAPPHPLANQRPDSAGATIWQPVF